MKYDVFISCKSEDYGLANNVYLYLVNLGYVVFLADKELRKHGNAEYGKIIDSALDATEHLILVASKTEYILSSYVESEWRIFIEEKRAGRKQGNIITILDDICITSLPISLRHFQSFSYKDFNKIKDYLPKFTTNFNDSKQIINNEFTLKYYNAEQILNYSNKIKGDTCRPFILGVDDVFSITGRGSVVTGLIECGKICVGDKLKLVRFNDIIEVYCTGIEMHRKLVDSAEAGDNVGILLRGILKNDISRGNVLTSSPLVKCKSRFTCDCFFIKGITTSCLQFYFRNIQVNGTIVFAPNTKIQMERPIAAEIELEAPVPINIEQSFAIRYNKETIGMGIIKELK